MVVAVVYAGEASAGGLSFSTRVFRLSRRTPMTTIKAETLSWLDGESGYTIPSHGPSDHQYTSSKRQLTLTDSAILQPSPFGGQSPRLLISLSEGTGAANTRAGRVVRVNVSQDLWRCDSLDKRAKRVRTMAMKRILLKRLCT